MNGNNDEKKKITILSNLPTIIKGHIELLMAVIALLTAILGLLTPDIEHFEVVPNDIMYGDNCTLFWSVSGATNVVINPGIGEVNSSGKKVLCPNKSTNYVIVAKSAIQREKSQLTTVEVNRIYPKINYFNAVPERISIGRSSKLMWSVCDAENVTLSGRSDDNFSFVIPDVFTSGDYHVYPNSSTTYILKAENDNGEDVKFVYVEIREDVGKIVLFSNSTSTKGAKIYIDGAYLETIPEDGEKNSLEIEYVDAGNHPIKVSNLGYLDYTDDIYVRGGNAAIIEFKLLKLDSSGLLNLQINGSANLDGDRIISETKKDILFESNELGLCITPINGAKMLLVDENVGLLGCLSEPRYSDESINVYEGDYFCILTNSNQYSRIKITSLRDTNIRIKFNTLKETSSDSLKKISPVYIPVDRVDLDYPTLKLVKVNYTFEKAINNYTPFVNQ